MVGMLASVCLTLGILHGEGSCCGPSPRPIHDHWCRAPHCRSCNPQFGDEWPLGYDYRVEFNYPWSVRPSSLHASPPWLDSYESSGEPLEGRRPLRTAGKSRPRAKPPRGEPRR
jgi:hypothetical protein